MSIKEGGSGKKEQYQWTGQMDHAFIQAMVAEQEKGNRLDGSFTTQAYANMVQELNKIFVRPINKSHLKNRLKTVKENFAKCYDVFRGASLSGFSWNDQTKLFDAEDEVWEALIVAKPDAAKWKNKPLHNYNELLELFARDRATGAGAETAKERKARMNNKEDITVETIDEVDNLVASDQVMLDNFVNLDDIQVKSPEPFSPEQPPKPKKCKSKKRKMEQEVEEEEEANLKIMSSVHEVANAIREGNTILQESNTILERAYQREYTGDEIYDELERMDLEPDDIASALIFLADNPKQARLLFSSPLTIRMKVLKKMMGPNN